MNMAKFVSSLVLVSTMIVFCFVLSQEASGSCGSDGCIYGKPTASSDYVFPTRKVLVGRDEPSRGVIVGSESSSNVVGDWELRRVPSGPDPLHHNGATPTKPRTTP